MAKIVCKKIKIKMHSEETIKFKNFTWVNVVSPTEEMLGNMAKRYDFHHLVVEDIISENQRSKIDEYEKYLFIVLHFPIINKRKKQIDIAEVDFVVGKNFFITLHEGQIEAVDAFFEKCRDSLKSRRDYMSKGTGYVFYEILDQTFDSMFPVVDDLEKGIFRVEKELFIYDRSEDQRDKLRDILLIKKDILSLRRVVGPQRQVIPQIEHKYSRFLENNLDIYFDNVVDKVEKIWSNLEDLKELVGSVHEINESIISHNTSNIIRILTVFSVIMMPLTVITGLYGMNVNLPLAQQGGGNPFNFVLIILFMLTVAGGMLYFFHRKKWL